MYRMSTVVKRYNDIVMSIGHEYSSIGTRFSENTDHWNIRDMVSEVQYLLELYYDIGTVDDLPFIDECHKFVKTYKRYVIGIYPFTQHCSFYDTWRLS